MMRGSECPYVSRIAALLSNLAGVDATNVIKYAAESFRLHFDFGIKYLKSEILNI